MENFNIQNEHVDDHANEEERSESEGCLICSNRCDNHLFEACYMMNTFKTLLGRELVDKCENECLSKPLLAIYILRKILNYPKAECEQLLKSSDVVNPREWFRLCEDCSEGVEKVLESVQQILSLEQKIEGLKKFARDKLNESLCWKSESPVLEDPIAVTVSPRNVIREYFRNYIFPRTQDVQRPKTEKIPSLDESVTTAFDNDFERVPPYIPEDVEDDADLSSNDNSEGESSTEEISARATRNMKRNLSKQLSANPTSSKTHRVCDVCGERMKKKAIFVHMSRFHPDVKEERRKLREKLRKRSLIPLNCDFCRKSPPNEYALYKHMQRTHKKIFKERENVSKLKCPLCPSIFKQKRPLFRHLATGKHPFKDADNPSADPKAANSEEPNTDATVTSFKCKKCNFSCATVKDKRCHSMQHNLADKVATKTSESKYSCKLCSEIFSNIKEIYLHARKCHKEELGIGPRQKRKVLINDRIGCLRVHDVVTIISDIDFKCNFCVKIFPTLQKACWHARDLHRKELGFKAKVRTKPKSSYKCSHCEKFFPLQCKLQSHIKTVHENCREIFCDKCGASFTERASLLKHNISFHSEKVDPKICDICGKSAKHKRALQMHKSRHHGPNAAIYNNKRKGPCRCTRCGMEFRNRKYLWDHTEALHPEVFIHQCSSCPQKFIKMSGLLAHEKKKHP